MRKLLLVSAAALAAALFIDGPAAYSTDMTAKNLRPEPTLQPVQVADKDDCHYIDRAGQRQNGCLPFVPVPLRLCDGKPILWGAHCDGAVTVKTETTVEHHKKGDHDGHHKHVKKDHNDHGKDAKGHDRDDHDKYGKDDRDDRDHRDGKKHDRDDHRDAKDDHGRDGKDGRDDRGHDKKYGDKDRDGHDKYGKDDHGRGDHDKYGKREGPKYSHKDEHGKIRFGKEEHKPFKFDRHFPGKELHGKHFVKHFRPNIKLHPVGHLRSHFVYHFKPKFEHFNFKGGLKFHHHSVKLHHGPKTKTTSYSRSGSNGSAAMQYVGGVIACMGTSLVLDGAIVGATENRETTYGEAYAAVGNCILPFVGGFIGHALGDGIDPCTTPGAINYTPGPGSVLSAAQMADAYRAKYCRRAESRR